MIVEAPYLDLEGGKKRWKSYSLHKQPIGYFKKIFLRELNWKSISGPVDRNGMRKKYVYNSSSFSLEFWSHLLKTMLEGWKNEKLGLRMLPFSERHLIGRGGNIYTLAVVFCSKFWSRLIKKMLEKSRTMGAPIFWLRDVQNKLKCIAKVLTNSQAKPLLLSIGKKGTNMAWSYLDVMGGDCAPESYVVLGVAISHLKSSSVGAFTWSSLRWFQLVVVRKKERVLVLVGTWMRHLKKSGVQGCLSVCDVLYCKV